jgi:nicotinamidase-related amidase
MNPLGPTPRNTWQVTTDQVDLRRPVLAARPVSIAADPQRLVIDLARTAMIIVDMQNDFCSPGGWLASIGVDISGAQAPIPAIASVLPPLRAAGVPVIWLNWGNRPDRINLPPNVLHVYDPAGRGVGIGSPLPGSGAHVLESGSWAAAIVAGLETAEDDIHIAKYRMSGFFDSPLESVLRNLRVDTLLFAGVNADQCVLATLTDAACLGYDAVMLEDAVGTTSPEFCRQATVYNVRQCFGFTALTASILAVIS